MIHKDTVALLYAMYRIETTKFVSNQRGSYGDLEKQGRIQKNLAKVMNHLNTNINSITTVTTEDGNMSIIVKNIREDNDHISNYVLTISDDFETFQVDEIYTPVENIRKVTVLHFEKIKI
jgi:hypothetical protein